MQLDADTITIDTRFGRLEATRQGTLYFTRPLPGFEGLSRFTLLSLPEQLPIIWLQSLEEAALALPLVEPDVYFPDYSQAVQKELGAEAAVLCLVSQRAGRLGLNLLAPLVIFDQQTAEQLVLSLPGLDIFHPLGGQSPCW